MRGKNYKYGNLLCRGKHEERDPLEGDKTHSRRIFESCLDSVCDLKNKNRSDYCQPSKLRRPSDNK